MKLLIILLLASFVCRGQSDTVKIKEVNAELIKDNVVKWGKSTLSFSDSLGDAAYKVEDSSWVIVDTTRFVRIIIKYAEYIFDKPAKERELLWAAQDILNYMKTDGTITNWRKWSAAVKKYQELLNKKE